LYIPQHSTTKLETTEEISFGLLDISDGEEFLEYKEVEKAKRRVTVFQISNLSALCACVPVLLCMVIGQPTQLLTCSRYNSTHIHM
jgi:hypothetical protein